jgi:hypothetical protein
MSCGVTSPNESQQLRPNASVDDLYERACDPSASPVDLRTVWESTKSVRVRKAVASNPNCDSKTMRMAARLYIKEVIANPSFELLNLFNEDRTVKVLYDAYTDPQASSRAYNLMSMKAGERINVARALLVSPKLNSARILQEVCAVLNTMEFKREIKDPDVNKLITSIAKKHVCEFRLPTLLFLFHCGIVDINDVIKNLDATDTSVCASTRGVYTSFLTTQIEKVVSASPDSVALKAIFEFVRVNRAASVRDYIKEVRKNPELRTNGHLKLYANLYREFLSIEIADKRKRAEERKKQYGWSSYEGFGENDHSHHLSDLVWTTISFRNEMDQKTLPDVDLSSLFNDIVFVGFDKDYGPYKCELKFPEMRFLTGRNIMCDKLLALSEDRAFEFYMTCGLLWREWYARGNKDNPETQVVNRMSRINEGRYLSGQRLWYRETELSDFPSIRINSRNGLDHGESDYDCRSKDAREMAKIQRLL